MKKLTALLLGLCLVAAAGAQSSDKWRKLKSPEGEFKVMIPGEWEHIHQQFGTEKSPTTLHINMHKTAADDDPAQVSYIVAWADLNQHINTDESSSDMENFFEGLFEQAANSMEKGVLVSDMRTAWRGNPGRDAEFDYGTGSGKIYMRAFLVNNRLYFLQVIGKQENITEDQLGKFFQSLQIKF